MNGQKAVAQPRHHLRFDYGDAVRVRRRAPSKLRPGAAAVVVGITTPEQRRDGHFHQFPAGVVYLIEYADGEAIDVHEDMLESSSDKLK